MAALFLCNVVLIFLYWYIRLACLALQILTGAQDSHLQTVTIPEAAHIQLRCRPPGDEQGNARNM